MVNTSRIFRFVWRQPLDNGPADAELTLRRAVAVILDRPDPRLLGIDPDTPSGDRWERYTHRGRRRRAHERHGRRVMSADDPRRVSNQDEHKPRRPASGKVRRPPRNPSEAIQWAIDLYGPPKHEKIGGETVLVWRTNLPGGNGILAARLSGEEIADGENIGDQLKVTSEWTASEGLVPAYLIATINNSGYNPLAQRPDLLFVQERIEREGLSWIAFRDAQRMGRAPAVAYGFEAWVRARKGAVLGFGHWNAFYDDNDPMHRMRFSREVDFNNEHGRMIKEMTHGKLQRVWVDGGWGYPGAFPFGFVRVKGERHPLVHEDSWKIIEEIHYDYRRFAGHRNGGVAGLTRWINAQFRSDLSAALVRRILSNTIYLDGKYQVEVTRDHKRVALDMNPIPLANPIDPGVFARNQTLLALNNGPNTFTPAGENVLNLIEFRCGACLGEQVDGKPIKLFVRGWSAGRKARLAPTIYHHPRVPESCKGKTWPRELVEAALMAELRRFVLSDELREIYAQQIGSQRLTRASISSPEHINALKQERKVIEHNLAELERWAADNLSKADRLESRMTMKEIAIAEDSIERLTIRIGAAEARAAEEVEAERRRETLTPKDRARLADALAALLTDRPPADEDRRVRRAALVQTLVRRIVLHEQPDGSLLLEMEGHQSPPDSVCIETFDPVRDAAHLTEPLIIESVDEEEDDDSSPGGSAVPTRPKPDSGGEGSHTIPSRRRPAREWERIYRALLRRRLSGSDLRGGPEWGTTIEVEPGFEVNDLSYVEIAERLAATEDDDLIEQLKRGRAVAYNATARRLGLPSFAQAQRAAQDKRQKHHRMSVLRLARLAARKLHVSRLYPPPLSFEEAVETVVEHIDLLMAEATYRRQPPTGWIRARERHPELVAVDTLGHAARRAARPVEDVFAEAFTRTGRRWPAAVPRGLSFDEAVVRVAAIADLLPLERGRYEAYKDLVRDDPSLPGYEMLVRAAKKEDRTPDEIFVAAMRSVGIEPTEWPRPRVADYRMAIRLVARFAQEVLADGGSEAAYRRAVQGDFDRPGIDAVRTVANETGRTVRQLLVQAAEYDEAGVAA